MPNDPVFQNIITQYGIWGLVLIGQWVIIGTLWKHSTKQAEEHQKRENDSLTQLYGLIKTVTTALETVQTKIGDVQGVNSRLFDLLERIVAGEAELKNGLASMRDLLTRREPTGGNTHERT